MGVEQEEEEVMASNVLEELGTEREREERERRYRSAIPGGAVKVLETNKDLEYPWWNILLFEIPLFMHLHLAVLFIIAPGFFIIYYPLIYTQELVFADIFPFPLKTILTCLNHRASLLVLFIIARRLSLSVMKPPNMLKEKRHILHMLKQNNK